MAGTSVDDGVALSISQFQAAWHILCSGRPGSSSSRTEGIDYIFSGLPVPFFNVALVTARGVSSASLETHGRAATAWAAGKAVPWMFIVTNEALMPGVDAVSVLDGCGLVPMIPMTGMVATRVNPAADTQTDLRVNVAHDEAGYAAIFDINGAAYGVDLAACKPVLGRQAFWAGHVPALGFVGATPVSSAAVLMVDGYRYVALVATDPAHQRRGYGETVMRHALDAAAASHGERPSMLHATDAGRPIYARMGYEAIATHMAYIDKQFLAGHGE